MEEVLPNLEETYIMDEINGGLLPLLPLRKTMEGAVK
jgi:membrane protease subunit HflK